jgi:hemerythrin-like metal-binding protein
MDSDCMTFLPEALTLCIEEIDDQHGNLFALLAEIKANCLVSNELPHERATRLIEFLREHFCTEEKLAADAGYDFSEHACKHVKMVSAIEKGLSEVEAGMQDVFSLLRYVEYWFERHIAEEDRPLSIFLHQTASQPGS